jgi:pimeloyl-ACP methyl ester carboxylesterase
MPPTGAPVVLLPGLVCDAAAWRPVTDLLPGVDCRADALPDHDTLGAIAHDVLRAAPPRFALAGHSMGGRVALEVVRRAPSRVTRLALLDTGFRPRASGAAGADERRQRHALLALARGQGMRAMGRRWSEPMVHPSRLADATLMDAVLAMIERSTPDRFARQIDALLNRPDASDVLATIRCPTLVLCGREDTWAPVAQHEALAARIPGSRLVVVAECGHMSPMERPGAVATALRDWLATDARAFPPAMTPPAQADLRWPSTDRSV